MRWQFLLALLWGLGCAPAGVPDPPIVNSEPEPEGLVTGGPGPTPPSTMPDGPAFSANPIMVDFGDTALNSTQIRSARLTNLTPRDQTISQLAVSGGPFTTGATSFPLTVAQGSTATVQFVFAPTQPASFSGAVGVIAEGAAASPLQIALIGRGVHANKLAWDPSVSPSVVGYNVYRSETSGGPYRKLNATPIVEPAYTDLPVDGCVTYYYTTTTVAADGRESGYSNEASKTVACP
jgi:hypothetical protein